MKTVKAKFLCNSVLNTASNKSVELSAVTTGSEENKSFAKYTPSGRLQMSIDNDTDAADAFVPGKEYILTITAAEDAAL